VPVRRLRLSAAVAMAGAAFCLYASTLLPGQDLGDTASFQAIAGESLLVPRQGYPLYFAIAGAFVNLLPIEAARAANVASAAEAALAVGLLVLVGAELGGTLVAGLVAGLLLAASYTFWSQAIIAEVYALHLLVLSASLLAVLHWERRPSLPRLIVVFALCALGFGNHLSTVLMLPGLALFLLVSAPGGPWSIVRPRVILAAAALAGLGALQYWWNLAPLVREPGRPGLDEVLRTFWFDVTKADWRANMVYGIPWSTVGDRIAMYWFDLRQQFGVPGAAAATIGAALLFRRRWRAGLLVFTLWAVNWAFAFTYNVGDVHVFYLPSHLMVALAAGCGAGWVYLGVAPSGSRSRHEAAGRLALAAALVAYPAWRAYDTYPAVDRSEDRAAKTFFDGLTAGLDGRREILGADMNWQLHNGLDYYVKWTRPDLTAFDVPDTLLYFPSLAQHNFAMGRSIALTEGSAAMVRAAYGRLFRIERDSRVPAAPLAERLATLPAGAPYVLALIEPYPETPLDRDDLSAAAGRLGLGPRDLPDGRYVVVAGLVGQPPAVRRAADRPFRLREHLGGRLLDVRFECWLPADTIRRAGFGHVIVDRRHVLTLDRAVSFVALGADGRARMVAWSGGLFAPQPRYLIAAPRPFPASR
jgi:hypothetical protein